MKLLKKAVFTAGGALAAATAAVAAQNALTARTDEEAGHKQSFYEKYVKRPQDFLLAAGALAVLSPGMLLISALIKTTSEGDVFFCQDRLGRDGKPFRIIKFRTMVTGAENKGDGLFVYGTDDSRITGIGKILRKTSLDELPQLINVVKGDMSIVGPRPPVTYFPYEGYEGYPDWAKKRFQLRPGITGLAQVRTRTTAPWDDRILIDNEYVDDLTFRTDAEIILKTVTSVLGSKNIYPESKEQINNDKNDTEAADPAEKE